MAPLLFLLAGCQEQTEEPVPEEQPAPEEPVADAGQTPEERLAEYITYWNEADFTHLYEEFLSADAKEAFGEETFIEYQQQLVEDLGIHDINITYTEPPEGTEWDENELADFPVQISMETLAGPIEFEETLTLLYEEQNGEENWFTDWGPSLVLPNLETGDNVEIDILEAAARGEIIDRNGQPLATNSTGYEVGIVPEKFTDPSRKSELAELLDVTVSYIDKQLNQSWVQPNFFVPLTTLPAAQAQQAQDADAIPGVGLDETAVRYYPYGEALSHVTGYVGRITAEQLAEMADEGYIESDIVGRKGLELQLEEQLSGEAGARITIEKTFGAETETIVVAEQPAADGETVKLTIDAELQKTIYDTMNGEAGASTAIDPATGETLALVSSPGFDPNEFVLGMKSSRFQELQDNPKNPLFNRFTARYAPGSTIKPITAAIGLEAGTLDPAAGVEINSKTWQRDRSWGNYEVARVHPEVPNPIDLNKALVYSDNIYFAQQGLALGEEKLTEGLTSFGFGEEIPFPMNLAASQITNDGTIDSEIQLADTSYGQGEMLANIVHLTSLYEAFINDGTIYEPMLFAEEEPEVWKENLVSAENAERIRTSLRNVVEEGPLDAVKAAAVPVAGKTGTVQLQTEGQQNGFFIGYNADQPSPIIGMMIEEVEDNDGSVYPAGLVTDVLEQTAN
ncbi:peptidoglycan glycosyltransferase [Planococcus lenghuensis]|uniref:Peptidoglycan glycosyltransferase n=1 Tax=Planococcus lenghuensis TaxID=2213202 RepID=A0A1Q2L3A3_9BACL|nr:peptidoglycan glycosyltransferase [Planococcus lenghuensis]